MLGRKSPRDRWNACRMCLGVWWESSWVRNEWYKQVNECTHLEYGFLLASRQRSNGYGMGIRIDQVPYPINTCSFYHGLYKHPYIIRSLWLTFTREQDMPNFLLFKRCFRATPGPACIQQISMWQLNHALCAPLPWCNTESELYILDVAMNALEGQEVCFHYTLSLFFLPW